MTSSKPLRSRSSHAVREAIAIFFWAYALLKLFVFDLDSYILGKLAPNAQWLLNLRLIAIAATLATLWLILGHRSFLSSLAYIIFYPFVILFWKLPRLVWRKWAVALMLVPTIYTTAVSFRSTLALYSFAAVSAAVIVFARTTFILLPAMIYLAVFLVISLYRSFVRAHSSSVFSQLAQLIRRFPPRFRRGDYDELQAATPSTAQLRKRCRLYCGSLSRPRPRVNRVSGDIG